MAMSQTKDNPLRMCERGAGLFIAVVFRPLGVQSFMG